MIRLFLLWSVLVFAVWAQGFQVYPSYFYTYGNNTQGKTSVSNAAYVSMAKDYRYYPVLAFDNLVITADDWKYRQKMLLGGMTFYQYPAVIKGFYGYIPGTFTYQGSVAEGTPGFNYKNVTNLFAIEAGKYVDWEYYSLVFTYLHANGPVNYSKEVQSCMQLTARGELTFNTSLYLSIKPTYFYSQRDKRSLFSVALKSHYYINSDLALRGGFMLGNRAYYFDTDVLTIFNQDETQTQNITAQADYRVHSMVSLSGVYVHSEFDGYQINYYGIGVKGSF